MPYEMLNWLMICSGPLAMMEYAARAPSNLQFWDPGMCCFEVKRCIGPMYMLVLKHAPLTPSGHACCVLRCCDASTHVHCGSTAGHVHALSRDCKEVCTLLSVLDALGVLAGLFM